MKKTYNVKKRGVLLTILLVWMLFMFVVGGTNFLFVNFIFSGGFIDIEFIGLFIFIVGSIAGLYGIWNWKKWGIYIFGIMQIPGLMIFRYSINFLYLAIFLLTIYLVWTKRSLFK